ncbi:MAG: hypothetical protein EBZ48_17050, partial [Proteobacteria bacterium]|nr:hypothetical protein [Pseudomonadota bacterium]
VAYRLKIAAQPILESFKGEPDAVLTSGNLPDLTVELRGLMKRHPAIPNLVGVITDTARHGEPTYVLGLVTHWEEGRQLVEALKDGTLNRAQAKVGLSKVIKALADDGIYYFDRNLSNFIVRTHQPETGERLEYPEIRVVDMGIWMTQVDYSSQEFVNASSIMFEKEIDKVV